jgi:cytochrome c-type biogenesis protein CcmH
MKQFFLAAAFAVLAVLSVHEPAHAQTLPPMREAAPLAQDPEVERRLNAISEELRCLVCQNESIAGSRAELAVDLRREIRTMISQGKTDKEIREFMVERYGDFVLYRPPMKASTVMLWVGPFVLLVGGFIAMLIAVRRRKSQVVAAVLTEEDQRRAQALLKGEEK